MLIEQEQTSALPTTFPTESLFRVSQGREISPEATTTALGLVRYVDKLTELKGVQIGIFDLVATPKHVATQQQEISNLAASLHQNHIPFVAEIILFGAIPEVTDIEKTMKQAGIVGWEKSFYTTRIIRTSGMSMGETQIRTPIPPKDRNTTGLFVDDVLEDAGALLAVVSEFSQQHIEKSNLAELVRIMHEQNILTGLLVNKNPEFWRLMENEIEKGRNDNWSTRQKQLMKHVVQTNKWIVGAGMDTEFEAQKLFKTHPYIFHIARQHPHFNEISRLNFSFGRFIKSIIGVNNQPAYYRFTSELMAKFLECDMK